MSGLRSVAQRSGLQFHLLSYQEFSNVPEGVVVLDACEFLSKEVFEGQLSIVQVAEMADLVRSATLLSRKEEVAGSWLKSSTA